MPPAKTTTGLQHFVRLNRSVYIHEPSTTSSASSKSPDLILLSGWMAAQPRHIAKYTAGYEKLFSAARILVITTSTLDAVFHLRSVNLNRIAPVLEVLYALPPNAKVLLHFFSNGGAFTAVSIARAYSEKTGRPLPVSAVVLDSAPGKVEYERTIRAIAFGLPRNMYLRAFGLFVIHLCYWFLKLAYLLSRDVDIVEKIRRDLNNSSLFQLQAPRLYVYSLGDDLVAWQDVEEHAEEAKGLGYVVDKEKFDRTSHITHMLTDENRYWTAVQRLWSQT